MHMSSVLRWSGTNSNEYGSIRTASSHISFVLRWFETSIIQRGTFVNRDIFINTLRPRQGSNFMARKEWLKTPQPMLLMTYLSLIFVYKGCLAQQLKIIGEYIAKIRCLKTMSIPHKKISGDISLVFFWMHINLSQNSPLYNSEALLNTYQKIIVVLLFLDSICQSCLIKMFF